MRRATHRSTASLRQDVYLQLRQAIERGTFAPGSKLPPSRDHARALGVARNTVMWALQRLQAEGLVVARVGDGTYVESSAVRLGTPPPKAISASASLSQRGQLIALSTQRWKPLVALPLPFQIGEPAVDEFPFALWQKLERQTPRAKRIALAHYLDPAGHGPLREAIAQWLLVSRGIRCDAQQVVITAGSQQAIDLIARLLLDPGDEVLLEDPGYPGLRDNFMAHGIQTRGVGVDEQGMCIEDGAARWPQARMAVVTPTHQFPMGVRMSMARRMALLDWAIKQRAWVVEDDYDGEFQYGTHRIPALCSMAMNLTQEARVLYVGTFSKSMHPGLRQGFVVLPIDLVESFARARALSDRHAPGAVQEVLARFISEGHLLRLLLQHRRRMRDLYRARQSVLIDAMHQASEGALQLPLSMQGMHLAHEVSHQVDDRAFSLKAAAAGVSLSPLSNYCMQARRRGWLFGYAGFNEATLRAAAQTLGQQAASAPVRR
jgi:GntR family transcriptional regulator / MocR family aminotransferase